MKIFSNHGFTSPLIRQIFLRHSFGISFILLLLSACGSSGSNLEGSYSVKDVNIMANDIQIGESVKVEVFFDTKYETDGSPDGVDVIVRVPSEVAFVDGSSRIYDNSTNDSDPYTPNDIVRCDTGEVYLVYNFSDFDLFGRQIEGPASFGFKFEVSGKLQVSATFIGATAGRGDDFLCGAPFAAEENEAVQVL